MMGELILFLLAATLAIFYAGVLVGKYREVDAIARVHQRRFNAVGV